MKRALVTGGEGFVGGYMIEALDEQGFEITNVDIKSGVDCRDFFKTCDTRYDLVVHLAAVVGGRATIEGNPISLAVDLSIDAEMFGWAVRTRQPHIVYYSSSAAYPILLQREGLNMQMHESLIDLDNVRSPDMTYGWAKLSGEYLAKFARQEGVRVDVFRPFSGYGTDQSLDYPFPSFIKRALDGANPFTVWGTGRQVRDWIHMHDVVAGTLAWIDAAEESVTVNLCTGRATTFMELAELVTGAASYTYEPWIQPHPEMPEGVMYRVGNPMVMEQVFKPRITLEEGIMRAVRGER